MSVAIPEQFSRSPVGSHCSGQSQPLLSFRYRQPPAPSPCPPGTAGALCQLPAHLPTTPPHIQRGGLEHSCKLQTEPRRCSSNAVFQTKGGIPALQQKFSIFESNKSEPRFDLQSSALPPQTGWQYGAACTALTHADRKLA